MNTKKVLLDTNVLMDSPEVLDTFENVILPIQVIEEIDGLKKSDGERGFKAREASRKIEANKDKIEFLIKDVYYNIPTDWDLNKNDNKIVLAARDNNCTLLSNDLNVLIKAKSLGVKCEKYNDKKKVAYKGYKEINGDTDFINKLFEDLSNGINTYDFLQNEYVILKNTDLSENDKDKIKELRFNNGKFEALRLPPSKVLKGMNTQQRFALDLLFNKDIPIKIICGTFGSGKTFLSVKLGLHMILEEKYKCLTFLRNPICADMTDIGYLPGDKSEKIYDYCRPFLQYVENDKEQELSRRLIREEKIKMDVISFIKGLNIDDSFVIMDEAEDLNVKLLKLVGTRIGKNACIVFSGDWKQAEDKYKKDNGLLNLIDVAKGNPLVGIVVLQEDVRSSASKVFADL